MAFLLLAVMAGGLFVPRPALAASPVLYSLDATLQYDAGVLTVHETVAFTNRTSQALDSLVFNVTPAFYHAFQLLDASVDARETTVSLDSSIMELPLPVPLAPGASTLAVLDFRVKVPNRGGRFGLGPQVIALGNWFPILAVYRDSRLLGEGQVRGWVRGKYVEIGDAFFSQTSDFQVTLTVDQPVEVAHTGDLVRRLDDSWRFEAKGVRDFALAVSRSFSKISKWVDGVQVNVYYLPGRQDAARTYLDAAVETLYWLSRTIEPYPYEHLDLAEINAEGSTTVGQEYPNLIFIADSLSSSAGGVDSYGSTLASHETAHQWFYGLVGNDQMYEPWMDEGMVTWLSYHLLRVEGVQSFDRIWQNRVVNPPIPDLPVNSGVYTYDTEGPYLAAVYRRGAVFLEHIYQAMGSQAFFAALRQYGAAMSGRIGAPFAFLDTMQAHTQVNLNPIISRYFTYPRYKEAEPLRVSAHYPSQIWSGTVRVSFDSSAALEEVRVFIDDVLYMTALPAQVVIETGQLGEGPHLLSIRASDGQRETDVIGAFTVSRPAPTPSPLPRATPTTVPGPQAPADQLPGPAVVAAAREAAPASPEVRVAGLALIILSMIVVAWGLGTNTHTGRRG